MKDSIIAGAIMLTWLLITRKLTKKNFKFDI